ncbi:MAG: hypothetical protein IKS47_05465 [Bacteroidales bacterium]|nr:hypothetical protein [Bacteroidales bacterium]
MAEEKKKYVKNRAPAKLELIIAIVHSDKVRFYTNLIQSFDVNLQLTMSASGTSEKAILNYLGLNDSNRSAIFGIVRDDKLKDVLEALDDSFTNLKGGGGIAVTVPFSSVIGTLVYGFLSNDKRTIQQ